MSQIINAGGEVAMSGAQIKAAYEGQANTNAFSDAEKAKLAAVGNLDLAHFGGVAGANVTAAFIAAAQYLLAQEIPGGTINVSFDCEVTAGLIDFWDILATEQSITPADGYFPNGEIIRGTKINLQGVGFPEVTVTGAGTGFSWGYFASVASKRAMSGFVRGIDFRGAGAIGHTAVTLIDNGAGQSYTTQTNGSAGTTNTDTICLDFREVIPNNFVEDCRFRYFQNAIHQQYGFGLNIERTGVQYCNIGAHFEPGVTTWHIGDGCEIEVCAVGVLSNQTAKGSVGVAVIEANLAGCDILLYASKFFSATGMWCEGSYENVVMIGDLYAPSLPNHGHTFTECIGPEIRTVGGVTNLKIENCPMGLNNEFGPITGSEQFYNVQIVNCTTDEGPFDLASITANASIAHEIQVTGPTVGKSLANRLHRGPIVRSGTKTALSSIGANTTFTLSVDNETTSGRMVIEGYWEPSTDYKRVSFKYAGVIQRTAGGATVVEFSTTESFVTIHDATGTGTQYLPAVPSTTVTGAVTATQTVGIEFALGTAANEAADTVWEASILAATDAIEFV